MFHDHIVVGFIISCELESRSEEVYSIKLYVIRFVNDLQQVSGFLQVLKSVDFYPSKNVSTDESFVFLLHQMIVAVSCLYLTSIYILFQVAKKTISTWHTDKGIPSHTVERLLIKAKL
jgi:hypothetical protein